MRKRGRQEGREGGIHGVGQYSPIAPRFGSFGTLEIMANKIKYDAFSVRNVCQCMANLD